MWKHQVVICGRTISVENPSVSRVDNAYDFSFAFPKCTQ